MKQITQRQGIVQIGALIALVPLGLVMYYVNDRWWLSALVGAFVVIALHYHHSLSRPLRIAAAGVMVIAVMVFAIRIFGRMQENLVDVWQWDFVGFWLHGTTAVKGLNFYDPQYAQQWAQPLTLTQDFWTEIVNVGFWYPPPSMFLFFPLGYFELQPAVAFWYTLHTIFLLADIWLIWRMFLTKTGFTGLAASAALMLSAYATFSTYSFSQINFLALLALLLFWQFRDRPVSGVWAAIGIFVKPFIGVLGLYMLLRRRWRALVVMVAAMAILSVASMVAFGFDTFVDFFAGSHVAEKPDFIYDQISNQSLLGFALRVTNDKFVDRSPLFNPLYIVGAVLFAGVTIWQAFRLDKRYEAYALSLCVLLGLVVYPVSQMYYSVLLVPILLLLWTDREQIPGGIWTIGALFGVVYALCAYQAGDTTFGAYALMWLFTAALSFRLLSQKSMAFVPPTVKAVEQRVG